MTDKLEDLIGQPVDVTRKDGDDFNHDFFGIVDGIRNGNVQVRDADDDVWEVDPDQVAIAE